MTIPPMTNSGRTFRLRGKGMPELRGNSRQGDLFIEVKVETPINLTKRQKELLDEFEKVDSKGHSPESEGFFAKVKELWEDLKE